MFNKKNLITDKDIVEISEDMNIEESKTKLIKWVNRLKQAIETDNYATIDETPIVFKPSADLYNADEMPEISIISPSTKL